MHAKQHPRSRYESTYLQTRESDVLHVSMQLDFCYITLMWGPPCWVPTAVSEVRPAFLLICFTTHRCLRAVQKTGGWRTGRGPRGSGCLSQANKCVWSEIREGRTQTKIPAEELLWQLCGFLSAKDAVQLERCDWLECAFRWVCLGSRQFPLHDFK